MKKIILSFIAIIFSAFAIAKNPQSVSIIKIFDNSLILADSKQGVLFNYNIVAATNSNKEGAFNLKGIDTKIALSLGLKINDFIIKDLAVNPESKEAYIAIEKITNKTYVPVMLVINQKGGIQLFDLAKNKHTEYTIADSPTTDRNIFQTTTVRSLTFTDLDLYNGKLYVSGMSNADFSSTLRVIDFPFNQKLKSTTTSVEIYHAVHNQMETRAPIRTMDIITLAGKPYILAAYTCTPLVLFPLEDIKDGAHIIGKTIAELGYGNTPIDLIHFKSQDEKGSAYDVAFLLNKNRSSQVISFGDIEKSNSIEGIKTGAGFSTMGTTFFNVPLAGALQVDLLNNAHIVVLRRDLETGELDLLSYMKGIYLRLSDFVSEYNLEGYKYTGEQEGMEGMQNMLKIDENHPEEVVK